MRSLSEIETTSKRASRATGFSWGIAEEVGKCVRLLELFCLPGIKNLNQYYIDRQKKNFELIKKIEKNNQSKKFPLCPIFLGVGLLDQIKILESFENCTLKNVAYPLLLMPFLSRASEIIGKKILFNFDDNKFLLSFNINLSSNNFDNKYPSIANTIKINFLKNTDSFSENEWQNLYKLSEDTFVEETESLKQSAAGAGLTDND